MYNKALYKSMVYLTLHSKMHKMLILQQKKQITLLNGNAACFRKVGAQEQHIVQYIIVHTQPKLRTQHSS